MSEYLGRVEAIAPCGTRQSFQDTQQALRFLLTSCRRDLKAGQLLGCPNLVYALIQRPLTFRFLIVLLFARFGFPSPDTLGLVT